MDFFTAMEVSASGLSAQRTRLNVTASNMANVSTTRSAQGKGPYQRKNVILAAKASNPIISGAQAGGFSGAVRGVEVKDIVADPSPPRLVYDPGHPDADPTGYVAYPNVNVVEEMVDMITASRAYEAGVTALNTAVAMAERALSIGK